MDILLVDAGHALPGRSWSNWIDGGGRFAMPSSGLVSVASVSRPHDVVRIHDEKVDGPIDPASATADVVGISFKTAYADHAYRMADAFRARGIPVVVGGVHATNVPEDAAQHADVVAVGEGETLWSRILDDLESGCAETFYRGPVAPRGPLDTLPRQRFELLHTERYMLHAVQSARGCSFDCEFCPTRLMFGSTYRLRDVDAMVQEVRDLLTLEDKPLFFTENVFGAGDLAFVEQLTSRIHALGARFGVICDWVMVRPELMQLLARNGCRLVCVNLTGRRTPEELAAVRAIRDAGMEIWGYLMFGFEEDTPDVFQGALDTVHEYDITCTSLTLLAPYPGTPMGTRLAREGRILDTDLTRYDQCNVVIRPAGMTAHQLQEGYDHVCAALAERCDFVHAVDALVRSGR